MLVKKNKYKNLGALALMISITCFAQIVTLMKSSVVAGIFGTGIEMDAYNFSNSIVSFLFGFISSSITTIVIPCYVHKKNRNNVDTFITALYGFILIIVAFIILFRYPIIKILSGKSVEFVKISAHILVVLLFSNYFYSITNITAAHFQCNSKYNTPKIINLIFSAIVVWILIINKDVSIEKYTLIIAIGLVGNFVIDSLFAIKEGWRYRPCFQIKNREVIEIFRRFLPIVYSSGVYKLSLMVDTIIASRLDTGKLTVLNYSNQVANMVNTILIGNLLLYSYPKIVARIKEKGNQKIFWEQVVSFHLIVCLIIAGFISVGQEGIIVLFQHGKFGSDASKSVFLGSLIYIAGQQINIVRDLIYRYFYAKGDTRTPAGNSVLVSIANIVLSIILVRTIGFYGILLGTVGASFLSLIVIMINFKKKIGLEISVRRIIKLLISNIMIMIVTITVIMIIKINLKINNNIISILFYGCATVIVFVIFSFIINKNGIKSLKSL